MAEANAGRTQQQNNLTNVQRKIDHLVDAISDGLAGPDIKGKLQSLTGQKEALQRLLAQPHASLPAMHSNLSELYQNKIAGLQEALANPDNTETIESLRELIDRVEIGFGVDAAGSPKIALTGVLTSMVKLGLPDKSAITAFGDQLFERSVTLWASSRPNYGLAVG